MQLPTAVELGGRLPNMVAIPGGVFRMGSDDHYPEEAPAHDVYVDQFWMDETAVTNADFEAFVAATGYVTLAERVPNPADYSGIRPDMLVPGSVVFTKPRFRVDLRDHYQWWSWVKHANWRHPEGKGSSIKLRRDHPVVHVAYEDAEAYARWVGKALPTEAEWERAARGGLDGAEYAWGSELTPGGKYLANFWQGDFPHENTMEDGFGRTAPVRSFPPNGYGLHEMIGNVWEWTTDYYAPHHAVHGCCGDLAANPHGGRREESLHPADASRIPRKVMKGGSFLCAESYCRRYRPAARMAQPVDTSTCHLGFRCVVRS